MSGCGCGCNSSSQDIIDVRTIEPPRRHDLIFSRFNQLDTGEFIVIVNDHDPKPLRHQFEAAMGHKFAWEYMEQGPNLWKVKITRLSCCGSCA